MYTTLTVLAYLFKIVNYYYYKERIVNFVEKLYAIQEVNNPDEIALSNIKERDVSRLTYTFLVAGHLAIGTSCFKAFSKENPEMPLVCWYPLDWKNDAVSFWILYPYSVICAFVLMHVNMALDCFSYYLMDTVATQVDLTGKRIEKLCRNNEKHESDVTKLNDCIQRHQHILE